MRGGEEGSVGDGCPCKSRLSRTAEVFTGSRRFVGILCIDENVSVKKWASCQWPRGHKTARKVGGVTGSIGGPLSINNVIIGC